MRKIIAFPRIRTQLTDFAVTTIETEIGYAKARATMAELACDLPALVTWRDVLGVARDSEYFKPATLDAVEAFLEAPLEWSAARGAVADLPPTTAS